MYKIHHLNKCKECSNIGYDLSKGIICEVTHDIASFTKKCNNYSENNELLKMESIKSYQNNIYKKKTMSFIKKHIISAFAIILLIITGYSMLIWPNMFTIKGKSSTYDDILSLIWSTPAGFLCLILGIIFGVIYVKKRKLYLL